MGFRNAVVAGVTLIRDAIQSQNYQAGVQGWSINSNGSAEFSNVVIRGAGSADPIVVGPSGLPQVIVRTTPTNGLIVFPTNRPIEDKAATANSAVINQGAANERAELQLTGPTVNGAPLGVRVVLGSRPQNASDVARFSIQNRDGTDVYFTADGDQVLVTGRPMTAERAAAANTAMQARITGEAQPRLVVTADGALNWGPGTVGADTNLYRAAVGILQTDDTFVVLGEFSPRNLVRGSRPNATDSQYETRAVGDTNARWFVSASGATWWGSGAAVQDTNLFRSAADTLKTDDNLVVAQSLSVGVTNWKSFTPVWSGLGTATLSRNLCWYDDTQGDMVEFEVYAVFNAAGSGTANVTFTLPFTPFREGAGPATTRQQVGCHAGGVGAGTNTSVSGSFKVLVFAGGVGATIDRITGPTAIDLRGDNITATTILTIQGRLRKV